jgi:hypothetical protein
MIPITYDDVDENLSSGCYLPSYGKNNSTASTKTMSTPSITYGSGTISTNSTSISGTLSIASTTSSNPVPSLSLPSVAGGYTFQQQLKPTSIHVQGDVTFEGEVKIKGVNISDRLDRIEQRLAILRPNSELEETWTELKALGDRYRELERELLEKQAVWDMLRK